jgi:zinc protease
MQLSSHSQTNGAANGVLQFPACDARTWTLPNGLGIIVQEDHSSPVASVQAWVETGSIHEDRQLGAGLSHILEHMLFKGTEKRSSNQIAQAIQDSGGYINAYTSFDRTVYWIDIPSKGVPVALDLLADAVMNSTLPADEFVKEQEVIRREFAMGYDDPDRVSGQRLFATAYREHPYRHPVIGHLDVFNRLTRDDVMAYYKGRYVPNNIFFVITGDVKPEAVCDQLSDFFKDHPRAAMPPVYIPKEPAQIGRREFHEEFETELTRLHLAWHIGDATHPDIPALDVLAVVLGSGRSSRFYKRLREELAIVHSIDAWCYAPTHSGLWGIDGVLDPGKRAEVEAEILRILDEVRREGVSGAELGKARKMALSHQLQAITTMRGKASDLGSNWLLARNLDFSRDYLAAIQRVDQADIKRVAQKYLVDSNVSVVSLNPKGSLATGRAHERLAAAGEIQKFELPNGLRLLIREDPRLPLVSMVATFKAGLLAETPENNGITRLLSRVLMKGTETRTAEQLADQIEAVGGSISSEGGNNSMSVVVRVMQPDLHLGLEILSDTLLNSTLPEKAIAREKEVQLASLKAEEEEMTSVARNLLRSNLLAGHPYGLRSLGSPESIDGLTQADLQQFRDRHLVGRNGVIAIFGNVKAEEVKKLVEKALGAMQPGEPAFHDLPQPQPMLSPLQVEEHRNKTQAVLMVGYLGADMFSPDRAALELIDEASSDIGSRFFIRIREEMGLAYFVGSSNMPGLVPGPFVFYLGTDPMKVTAVQAELMDEIRKLAEHGLTSEELARAKEKLIGQQEIRNQSNDSFAFAAALDELYGLGANHYRELKAEIEGVTLEDVKRVANKYFLGQPPVIALVRPEPGTEEV